MGQVGKKKVCIYIEGVHVVSYTKQYWVLYKHSYKTLL